MMSPPSMLAFAWPLWSEVTPDCDRRPFCVDQVVVENFLDAIQQLEDSRVANRNKTVCPCQETKGAPLFGSGARKLCLFRYFCDKYAKGFQRHFAPLSARLRRRYQSFQTC